MILPAQLDQVASARRAVRTLLYTANAPQQAVDVCELAVGELVANAIRYGSGTAVEFSLRVGEGEATVIVTNDGPIFTYRSIDLTVLTFEESGRGLAMLVALGCALKIDVQLGRCAVSATVSFAGRKSAT